MEKTKLNQTTLTASGFAGSAILLTFIQVPFKAGFLAWICLVPFILVCSPEVKRQHLIWISYIVSVCYWLINIYWLSYITVVGYIAFCLYLGLYWPFLALGIRTFRKISKVPYLLFVPLLFCGAEAWQGILITGFNWRLLGHSQYDNLRLIQIADIFGQMGVSFIVAIVNGLIAELIIDTQKKHILRIQNYIKTGIIICIIAAALIYGHIQINNSEEHILTGPVVGSVQPNVPSLIKEMSEQAEPILDNLIILSQNCFDAGAELVIWPETMVLTSLNSDYINLCKLNSNPVIFNNKISEFSKNKGYILVGANGARINIENNEYKIANRYNSAYLYGPDGKQSPQRYNKIHLVPFGEYMPFREGAGIISTIFEAFNPYDYDYNLTAGQEYTRFFIKTNEKIHNFGVLICYEDTDAEVTRKMVVNDTGDKKTDFLVNISNDGWYVKYIKETGQIIPSTELSQRTAISVFRAVENRISIIRSVNTGISCVIDPLGRIQNSFLNGNLPQKVLDRDGVEGWFTDRIIINKQITFFSRHGKWLNRICAFIFIFLILTVMIDAFLSIKYHRKNKLRIHNE